MVNPLACHETEVKINKSVSPKKIAVVGAGPAGLAYATTAAERGHKVTLYEKSSEIGGQFNMAKKIPGKEEFYETLRYYKVMIEKHMELQLNTLFEPSLSNDFDRNIGSGIHPRIPSMKV